MRDHLEHPGTLAVGVAGLLCIAIAVVFVALWNTPAWPGNDEPERCTYVLVYECPEFTVRTGPVEDVCGLDSTLELDPNDPFCLYGPPLPTPTTTTPTDRSVSA